MKPKYKEKKPGDRKAREPSGSGFAFRNLAFGFSLFPLLSRPVALDKSFSLSKLQSSHPLNGDKSHEAVVRLPRDSKHTTTVLAGRGALPSIYDYDLIPEKGLVIYHLHLQFIFLFFSPPKQVLGFRESAEKINT